MSALRAFVARLRGMFSRSSRLEEELAEHAELLAAERMRAGESREAAMAAARRELGNTTRVREEFREQARLPLVDSLWQDVRYTLRQWRLRPWFAATAIATLTLAIGANGAIFQLLDYVVLRPLPVRDPRQLAVVQGYWGELEQGFSYPLLREMNARQRTTEGLIASAGVRLKEFKIQGRDPQEEPRPSMATGNYFRVLGTNPQVGRLFVDSDDKEGAAPVAVLSDRFWRREFGGQTSVIGSTMQLNGVVFTIAGVTRPEFFGERVGQAPDFWVPLVWTSKLTYPGSVTATSIWLTVMTRPRAGVSLERAQAELGALWSQLRELTIPTKPDIVFRLELRSSPQGLGVLHLQYSKSLWLLMGLVGLVALLACCNLANLLLARGTFRQHELGLRLAIGAGRGRLMRQLLTESSLLALVGGAAGLAVAVLAARGLVRLASLGETWEIPLQLDARIAVFTLLVSTASILLFGVAPAFWGSRLELTTALRADHRSQTEKRSQRAAARLFVIAQVALSFLLVAGASLLVRSFWTLTHQDFGFQPRGLAAAQLVGGDFKEMFNGDVQAQVAKRLQAVAGVLSAGLASPGLLPRGVNVLPGPVQVEEGTVPSSVQVRFMASTPGYLETAGIRILRGRALSAEDRKGMGQVAVISQMAAAQIFGTTNPLGKRIASGKQYRPERAWEVVGVFDDVRSQSPRAPLEPIAFVPTSQWGSPTSPTILVRTDSDPERLSGELQRAVKEVAPSLKLGPLTTYNEMIEEHARQERLLAWLAGGFGFVALLLAGVGLYGVAAYAAARRTSEIGVRLALGAEPRQIRAMLLREALALLGTGLLLGATIVLLVGKTLSGLLYQLTPQDPASLTAAVLSLSAVTIFAGYLPVRRAASIDPMKALRQE